MQKLGIPDKDKTHVICPARIICIEGDGRYSTVFLLAPHTKEGWFCMSVCRTLKDFEYCLDEDAFHRINKSYIVAIDQVKAVGHNRLIELHTPCCTGLVVSKENLDELYRKLNWVLV